MNGKVIASGAIFLVLVGFYLSKKTSFAAEKPSPMATEGSQSVANAAVNDVQNGDVIFQTSLSDQSKAIQLATHSKYSHCGIIYEKDGAFYVFEAVQPVRYTKLEQWIRRGAKGAYVIKRLNDAPRVLTDGNLQKMRRVGEQFKGKNYDLTFGWSDEKIYCSELVWKIYQRALGVELAPLQRLRDFDLSSAAVQAKLRERYGNNPPMDEPVISPNALFESPLLFTVKTQ